MLNGRLGSLFGMSGEERSAGSVCPGLATLLAREFSLLLARHDPAWLTHHGAPDDEYDSEAREIVRRMLGEARSAKDVESIASDVFAEYFPRSEFDDDFGPLSREMWHLYERARGPAP